jgi:hypothetical protein
MITVLLNRLHLLKNFKQRNFLFKLQKADWSNFLLHEPLVLYFYFSRELALKSKKTGFSGLSQNFWLIHFNGPPAANN